MSYFEWVQNSMNYYWEEDEVSALNVGANDRAVEDPGVLAIACFFDERLQRIARPLVRNGVERVRDRCRDEVERELQKPVVGRQGVGVVRSDRV